MPKVSVIIPSFNHEKYVAEAIQSVLVQTFQDFEIVITDDGSSDGTVNEILKFTDTRIRFFRFETNQGACVAANKCIRESRGQYIAVLSSDDIFNSDKLEKQVRFLDNHNEVGAVFGYAQLIDEDGGEFADTAHRYSNIFIQPNRSRYEWLNQFFYQGNCLCHPSALIRRECYEVAGLYDPRYAQLPDLDFWIRLCQKYEIHIIPENLIKFRIHKDESNASGNRMDSKTRLLWEYPHIYYNYVSIKDIGELLRIFPELAEYRNISADLIPFLLSKLALNVKTFYPAQQLFALNILHHELSVPVVAEKAKKYFGFTWKNYIELTGTLDVLGVLEIGEKERILGERERIIASLQKDLALIHSEVQSRDEIIADRDNEIASLKSRTAERALIEQEISRLRAIEESATWKGVKKVLKVIDNRILPPHTRRSKIVRPAVGQVINLFTRSSLLAAPQEEQQFNSGTIEFFTKKSGAGVPDIAKISFMITPFDQQSKRYRVYNLIEELTAAGIDCCTFHESDADHLDLVLDCNVLIVFRVAMNGRVEDLIREAHARNIPVIFDIDDLIFDPECLDHFDGLQYMPEHEKRNFIEGINRWKATLLASDYCTCTTETLKNYIEGMGKKAFVIKNSINNGQYNFAKQLVENRSGRRSGKVKIGYFSGTNTHNRDFLEVANALLRILRDYPLTEFHLVGELTLDKRFNDFGDRVVMKPLMPHLQYLEYNSYVDINLAPLQLNNIFTAAKSELKIFESALVEVPTIASPTESYAKCIIDGVDGFLAATEDAWYQKMALLIEDPSLRKKMAKKSRKQIAERFFIKNIIGEVIQLYQSLARNYRVECSRRPRQFIFSQKLPVFSIVSVLYNKEKQLGYFIDAFARQTYPGKYEIVFVDDLSEDSSVNKVQEIICRASGESQKFPNIRLLRNERNVGNCVSRNAGIKSATGDIIVVIDADCIVNKDFLSAHAEAYAYGDCDVAIGPLNLETQGKDPFTSLNNYEESPDTVLRDALPQDMINQRSFVNCITRNFSIRKEAISEELFDVGFSYSRDKDSGFGWEDVEMGYRLYKQGARIKFLPDAFSIHISHPSSVDERIKPLRSLKNFRKLHEKHPELLLTARHWSLDTYQKICEWSDHYNHKKNNDHFYLEAEFERFLPPPFYIKSSRKLKILTYRWHCSHQYELYKLPYEFTLAKGCGTGITENWDYDKRPLPGNAHMKHIEEINPKDYDIAILHFDENVLSPENTNNVITPEWRWGETFKWFRHNLKMPMVAVCHGTPQFYGQYNIHYNKSDLLQPMEQERQKMVNFMGNVPVVVNSYQAQREWGFHNSKVIWHGFDPAEFYPSTYDKDILMMLEKALLNRPHYNGYFITRRVMDGFPEGFKPEMLFVPEPHSGYPKQSNAYARAKFRNYVDVLRKYSIYFNPTMRSPMPRSRGEAMMCGLVTVSLNNHDVDLFIKNGTNGFYSDDPDELREYLRYLLENPEQCRKIGSAGRKTAMDIFNHDRYLQSWEDLLSDLLK